MIKELNELFSARQADVWSYLKRWREHAVQTAVDAFQAFRAHEKRTFGTKSFWAAIEAQRDVDWPVKAQPAWMIATCQV